MNADTRRLEKHPTGELFFPTATSKSGRDSFSEAVIGAAFEVSNTLGAGFLERFTSGPS